jgi:ribosomal protein S27AE
MDKWGRLTTGHRHVAAEKQKECPKCGSKRMARIQYGLPAYDAKMERDIAAGKLVLGGCCITGDDPRWQCADCGVQVWDEFRPLAR